MESPTPSPAPVTVIVRKTNQAEKMIYEQRWRMVVLASVFGGIAVLLLLVLGGLILVSSQRRRRADRDAETRYARKQQEIQQTQFTFLDLVMAKEAARGASKGKGHRDPIHNTYPNPNYGYQNNYSNNSPHDFFGDEMGSGRAGQVTLHASSTPAAFVPGGAPIYAHTFVTGTGAAYDPSGARNPYAPQSYR